MTLQSSIKKLKKYSKNKFKELERKISNKDGSLTRIIFGTYARNKVIKTFMGILYLGLVYFAEYFIIDSAQPDSLMFIILFFSIIKITFILVLLNQYLFRKTNTTEILNSLTTAFVVSDIFVAMYFSKVITDLTFLSEANIANIVNTNLIALIPVIPLIFYIFYQIFKKKEAEQIQGNSKNFNLLIMIFVSIFISLILIGFAITPMKIGVTPKLNSNPFKVKDIIMIIITGILIAPVFKGLFFINKNSTNLNKSDIGTNPKNGERVYLIGEYSRLYIFSEDKKEYLFNFEDKNIYFEISCGDKKYMVYGGHNLEKLKDSDNNKIYPGAKLEIWGKFLNITKNGRNFDYINPSKIYILEK